MNLTKNLILGFSVYFVLLSTNVFAHGERAQQAGLRMRAVNWFDIEVSQTDVKITTSLPSKVSLFHRCGGLIIWTPPKKQPI